MTYNTIDGKTDKDIQAWNSAFNKGADPSPIVHEENSVAKNIMQKDLETYLKENNAKQIIDFRLRADVRDGITTFYIHPLGIDGETLDFIVKKNQLVSPEVDLRDIPKHEVAGMVSNCLDNDVERVYISSEQALHLIMYQNSSDAVHKMVQDAVKDLFAIKSGKIPEFLIKD